MLRSICGDDTMPAKSTVLAWLAFEGGCTERLRCPLVGSTQ
ncbi:hypothetical protein [Rhizobium redzepovicii]